MSDSTRLISLSMIRNEQDIIEPFIRHTRRLVDAMIILLNECGDGTPDIVKKLSRELGGIIYADAPGLAYAQSDRMTALLRGCQTAFFADYIFLLDADEFLDVTGRDALTQAISAIPVGGYGTIAWQTFIHSPNGDQSFDDPPRCFHWMRAIEAPRYTKAIARLDGAYIHDLIVPQGNHTLEATGRQLRSVEVDGVGLCHFPVRSPDQLTAKAAIGWAAYLALGESRRHPSWAWNWAKYFAQVRAGAPFTPEQASEEAFKYGQDTPPPYSPENIRPAAPPGDYERRYSTGAFRNPLGLIVDAWARSLEPVKPVIELKRPDITDAGAASPEASRPWDEVSLDLPPFKYLADKYAPGSVTDYGCGVGGYLRLFKELSGSKVLGIDDLPLSATLLADEDYRQADPAAGVALDASSGLAICVEIVARLPDDQAVQLLGNVAANTKDLIVFSAAEVGQPGDGYVNRRDLSEWLERWRHLGWYPDLYETLGIRAISTLCCFRRNLVVLKNGAPPAWQADADALIAIARRPYTWPEHQEPGMREYAFCDPPTMPPFGYRTSSPVAQPQEASVQPQEAGEQAADLALEDLA